MGRRTLRCQRLSPLAADVGDAAGADLAIVDRRLLVGHAGARQIREEVRAETGWFRAEPGVKPVENRLSRVQALAVGPGIQVIVPGLPASEPVRAVPAEPVLLVGWLRQPVEAPQRGRFVEPFPGPLHDHDRAAWR